LPPAPAPQCRHAPGWLAPQSCLPLQQEDEPGRFCMPRLPNLLHGQRPRRLFVLAHASAFAPPSPYTSAAVAAHVHWRTTTPFHRTLNTTATFLALCLLRCCFRELQAVRRTTPPLARGRRGWYASTATQRGVGHYWKSSGQHVGVELLPARAGRRGRHGAICLSLCLAWLGGAYFCCARWYNAWRCRGWAVGLPAAVAFCLRHGNGRVSGVTRLLGGGMMHLPHTGWDSLPHFCCIFRTC